MFDGTLTGQSGIISVDQRRGREKEGRGGTKFHGDFALRVSCTEPRRVSQSSVRLRGTVGRRLALRLPAEQFAKRRGPSGPRERRCALLVWLAAAQRFADLPTLSAAAARAATSVLVAS